MINLKNLIDFLPFEYKDQDTYKVDGKGILERFLEICGEHFEDSITKDIEGILDIIDLDKAPDMYLNFLWQFLGEMPFAYGDTIEAKKWEEYFNGFYSDRKLQELSRLWLIPKEGPFSLTSTQVRNILRYSVTLFKIRGTAEFFEIMMRMYGLTCTVSDPAVSDSYDGWIKSHPYFDRDSVIYDDRTTYDNTFDCSQCIPVTFTIGGHGYTSNTESFKRFREAIEGFFKRFIPYHVSFKLNYGFTVDDGYSIRAELVDPSQPNLIQSEVYEVPVRVIVTSTWKDADLRYQISDDQINWGYTKHANGSVFTIPKAGTYYFRSVGDPTKVTSITVKQEAYSRVYQISFSASQDELTIRPDPTVIGGVKYGQVIVRAKMFYKSSEPELDVRLRGTNEVHPSGHAWTLKEPGTYIFEIVAFPVKFIMVTITKEPETFKVTCNPNLFKVQDNQTISDARTILNITSNYPDTYFKAPLYCKLLGLGTIFKKGDTFIASSYGIYKFKCTLDKRETEEGVGSFEVISGKRVTYRISLSTKASTISNGEAKVTVFLDSPDSTADDFRVRVVETGEIFEAKGGHVYITNKPGNYTFQSVAYPAASVTWVVKNEPTAALNKLGIVPLDETDPNWVVPDWSLPSEQLDDTYAEYQLTQGSICKFSLEAILNGGIVSSGDVILEETKEAYKLGQEIELKDPGIYNFFLESQPNLTCQVNITDYPLELEISCNPTEAELGGTVKQVQTVVKVTANKEKFNGLIQIQGPIGQNQVDAGGPNGYVFITSTAGTYTFTSLGDPTKYCTFTVKDKDVLAVDPQVLTWESNDLSEKTFKITTYSNQPWEIIKT